MRRHFPHLTPALSALEGGEGERQVVNLGMNHHAATGFGARTPSMWQIATIRSARFNV
jgi:hypothetical protein